MTIWANTRKLFTPEQIDTARERIRQKFPKLHECDVDYMTSAWLERQICKSCDGSHPCPLSTNYWRAAYIGATVYNEKEVRLQRCQYKRPKITTCTEPLCAAGEGREATHTPESNRNREVGYRRVATSRTCGAFWLPSTVRQ